MSPASGLVSILKKRHVYVDNVSVSASLEPQPDQISAKRRVRFKVPDDGYEQGVFVYLLPTGQRLESLSINMEFVNCLTISELVCNVKFKAR